MAFTNLLEIFYPVGTIYLSSISTSPAEIIGGTWQQITDGRFWRPQDSYGTTGGKNTYMLTYRNIPGGFWNSDGGGTAWPGYNTEVKSAINSGDRFGMGVRNKADGPMEPVWTLPAYRTCYCWVRIS